MVKKQMQPNASRMKILTKSIWLYTTKNTSLRGAAWMDETDLHRFRYDVVTPGWDPLPVINRDLAGDRITVVLDHFSEFILAAPTGIKNPIYIPLLVR
jgi:hypothetical protein